MTNSPTLLKENKSSSEGSSYVEETSLSDSEESNSLDEETTEYSEPFNTSSNTKSSFNFNDSCESETSSDDSGGLEASDEISNNIKNQSQLIPYNCKNKKTEFISMFQNTLCIQMEYCEGLTLNKWLSIRSNDYSVKVDYNLCLNMSRQILEGINYFHAAGIIHRDLKPENIFYNYMTNTIKIGDFGLATYISSNCI